MELNEGQIAEFDERGYLFLPKLLDDDEAACLQAAMPDVLNREGPEVVREKHDPAAARLAFGAHVYSEPFRALSLLPRLVNPTRQLLRDDVYLHQSRINPKPGFGKGTSWDWHQDFGAWHVEDGMPEPRCMMTAVFIDDCSAARSPLLAVPGTQQLGLVESKLHKDARGYALYHLDEDVVEREANAKGIEALIGPAGSVCFMHPNVLHGSSNNVSPWPRAIMYLIYNAVSNACVRSSRPWYQNNRDLNPLHAHDDDSLRALA